MRGEANEQSLVLEDELFVLTTRGGSAASGTTAVSRLSLEDGSAVWTLPVRDQVPQVGDTVVYLTGPDDEIVAVTREDGDELWRDELPCETLLHVHDFLVCMQQVRPGSCTYEADD